MDPSKIPPVVRLPKPDDTPSLNAILNSRCPISEEDSRLITQHFKSPSVDTWLRDLANIDTVDPVTARLAAVVRGVIGAMKS